MKLEELLPEAPSFDLKSTKKTYKLRIPNLEDRARFQEILGQDPEKVSAVFEKLQWNIIAQLVYRLLEDKAEFPGSIELETDDDGFTKETRVTGPQKLLRAVTGGLPEAMKMLNALIAAMRAGDPIVDQAAREAVGSDKKKAQKLNGATSSTLSAPSTDTHQNSLPSLL